VIVEESEEVELNMRSAAHSSPHLDSNVFVFQVHQNNCFWLMLRLTFWSIRYIPCNLSELMSLNGFECRLEAVE